MLFVCNCLYINSYSYLRKLEYFYYPLPKRVNLNKCPGKKSHTCFKLGEKEIEKKKKNSKGRKRK